jgi:Heterokaryon incompatibility protein (HET)
MVPYAYQRLSRNNIRIFSLHPGKGDDHLFGSLTTVNQVDYPEYEALSYVWGDASIKDEIVTPNGTIEICGNLQTVFRYLRHVDKPRILWADQICINQKDVQEKEEQVEIMQKIYIASKRTLIFLGEETRLTSMGVKFLSQFIDKLPSNFIFLEKSEQEEAILRTKVPPRGAEEWNALRSLIISNWFNRTWTLQEAIVPKEIEFIIGNTTIPGEDFLPRIDTASKIWLLIQTTEGMMTGDTIRTWKRFSSITQLRDYRIQWRSPRGIKLTELLRNATTRGATLKVDRLFAMRALASDAKDTCLNPDYRSEEEEVLERYAKCLYERQSLALLNNAGTSNQILNLPSWVPDWTTTKPAMTYDYLPFSSQLQTEIQIDGKHARLWGVIFDKVGSIFETDSGSTDQLISGAFQKTMESGSRPFLLKNEEPTEDFTIEMNRHRSTFFTTCYNRQVEMSIKAKPADWIVFFPGATNIYIIRKASNETGTFKLICQCFIKDLNEVEMMGLYRRSGKEIVLE